MAEQELNPSETAERPKRAYRQGLIRTQFRLRADQRQFLKQYDNQSELIRVLLDNYIATLPV